MFMFAIACNVGMRGETSQFALLNALHSCTKVSLRQTIAGSDRRTHSATVCAAVTIPFCFNLCFPLWCYDSIPPFC